MPTRVIAALAFSALLVGLGYGLSDGTDAARTYAVPLTVLAGATAATTVTLWAAAALGLARRSPIRRPAHRRLEDLHATLVRHARSAAQHGPGVLAAASLPGHIALWRLGTGLLAAAGPSANIRPALAREADAVLAEAGVARLRVVAVLRLVPVAALCLGLATAVWMMGTLAWPRDAGTFTPLALIVALYGSFAVAALSQEAGDRVAEGAAEAELGAAMIIETFAAIAAGEDPDRLDARLGVMLGGEGERAPTPALRRAA